MDESLLIQHLRNGDPSAFRSLVDAYQDRVYNTIYGFVHDTDDALDLTQDVFVEFYQSFSKFRGDSSINTWIYRIAVNKALNHLRRKKQTPFSFLFRKPGTEKSTNILADPADSALNPSASLENTELKQQLQQAIDALPEKQRIAFILDKLEDMPYKEIASVMQTSLSAVESLIHRAKLNLQKNLLEVWENK